MLVVVVVGVVKAVVEGELVSAPAPGMEGVEAELVLADVVAAPAPAPAPAPRVWRIWVVGRPCALRVRTSTTVSPALCQA